VDQCFRGDRPGRPSAYEKVPHRPVGASDQPGLGRSEGVREIMVFPATAMVSAPPGPCACFKNVMGTTPCRLLAENLPPGAATIRAYRLPPPLMPIAARLGIEPTPLHSALRRRQLTALLEASGDGHCGCPALSCSSGWRLLQRPRAGPVGRFEESGATSRVPMEPGLKSRRRPWI